jgi:hypothetical protein
MSESSGFQAGRLGLALSRTLVEALQWFRASEHHECTADGVHTRKAEFVIYADANRAGAAWVG